VFFHIVKKSSNSLFDENSSNFVARLLMLFCCSLTSALQRHNNENSEQIFQEKELRGYSPNSYTHVSVSDLYIPLIGLPILLPENRWTKRGNL
jgi:hypothetical protein